MISTQIGENLRLLTNHPTYERKPTVWSPDGKQILGLSLPVVVMGVSGIYVMNAQDGKHLERRYKSRRERADISELVARWEMDCICLR